MQLTVFAFRYTKGVWKYYEHYCDEGEMDAVIDSAKAKAFEHLRPNAPYYVDFLAGARYIFNVAYGPSEDPAEGDLRVFAVKVDGVVVGPTADLEELLARKYTKG